MKPDSNWLYHDDKITKVAHGLSNEYLSADENETKEKVLTQLLELYLVNFDEQKKNIYTALQNFITYFDSNIPEKEKFFFLATSKINIYTLIINLLKKGIPVVPHFFGLKNFGAKDANELIKNPALIVALEILRIIEKEGYKAAFEEISSPEFKKRITNVNLNIPFYQYLLGQIFRKNNAFHKSINRFDKGITILNKYHSTFWDNSEILLLSELYRGKATVYRKLISQEEDQNKNRKGNANEDNRKQAKEYFTKAQEQFERLSPPNPEYAKVGSDIFFSFGYFLFESFFSSKQVFKSIDQEGTSEAINTLVKSINLNTDYTAPLARKGILELYLGNWDTAFHNFLWVFDEDNAYLKQNSDHERIMAQIWVGIALLELEKIKPSFKGNHDVKEEYISNLIHSRETNLAAIDKISKGILECHTYDLGIILQTLRMHSKLKKNYIFDEKNPLITAYWKTVKELGCGSSLMYFCLK